MQNGCAIYYIICVYIILMTIPTLNAYHRTTNSGFNVQNERGVAKIIKRAFCTRKLSLKSGPRPRRRRRRRRRRRSIKKKSTTKYLQQNNNNNNNKIILNVNYHISYTLGILVYSYLYIYYKL